VDEFESNDVLLTLCFIDSCTNFCVFEFSSIIVVSHVREFVEAVAVNWRTAIAAVVFVLFSFPNAVLSEQQKRSLEQRFPPFQKRRQIVLAIAAIYVFIACFLAWDEQRNNREIAENTIATIRDKGDRLNILASLMEEGNKIQNTFIDRNDKELIKEQFAEWDAKTQKELKDKFDYAYLAKFRSTQGGQGLPLGHSVEGGTYWALIQAKILTLADIVESVRNQR
jgi:hypothetical protein